MIEVIHTDFDEAVNRIGNLLEKHGLDWQSTILSDNEQSLRWIYDHGYNEFPAIFVDAKCIGGFEELLEYLRDMNEDVR